MPFSEHIAIAFTELYQTMNCIGFIDGTTRRMARPSIGGSRHFHFDQSTQVNTDHFSAPCSPVRLIACWCITHSCKGHKRIHALKYLGVVMPDGIMAVMHVRSREIFLILVGPF